MPGESPLETIVTAFVFILAVVDEATALRGGRRKEFKEEARNRVHFTLAAAPAHCTLHDHRSSRRAPLSPIFFLPAFPSSSSLLSKSVHGSSGTHTEGASERASERRVCGTPDERERCVSATVVQWEKREGTRRRRRRRRQRRTRADGDSRTLCSGSLAGLLAGWLAK